MPFSFRTKWMIDHPAWTWFVFSVNTFLIAITVTSILILGAQQRHLIHEIGEIDRKLVQALKINQNNVDVVAKKAGVPEHKIVHPELPNILSAK